jgi:hypothetical protein
LVVLAAGIAVFFMLTRKKGMSLETPQCEGSEWTMGEAPVDNEDIFTDHHLPALAVVTAGAPELVTWHFGE